MVLRGLILLCPPPSFVMLPYFPLLTVGWGYGCTGSVTAVPPPSLLILQHSPVLTVE